MKKIISLFIAVIVLIMMLSACTPSGMPTSLVGIWKSESQRYVQTGGYYDRTTDTYVYEYSDDPTTDIRYFEITDDDYIIAQMVYYMGINGFQTTTKLEEYKENMDKSNVSKENVCSKIIKATCNELQIRPQRLSSDNKLMVFGYELSGNTLTLKFANGVATQTYTKE